MTSPRANAPAPKFRKYDTLEQVAVDIQGLFNSMQPKTHRVVAVAPIATDLKEGEFVIYDNSSGTIRIYTKVNGTVRLVALT